MENAFLNEMDEAVFFSVGLYIHSLILLIPRQIIQH